MTKISKTSLNKMSHFISENIGLHFPEEKSEEFSDNIVKICHLMGYKDAETGIVKIINSTSNTRHFEIITEHLTIGETYFFRDKLFFENLENVILSELIDSRKKVSKYLRIWSAGCSTGEEAYSIAILLRKIIPDLKNWNIKILATDINNKSLGKASRGFYKKWSFRDIDQKIQNKYFVKSTLDQYHILRKLIRWLHSHF